MDLDLSEEDQMMRAIAMSLGENVTMSSADNKETEKKEEVENKKKEEEKDVEKDRQIPEEPLSKETIDQFTETMMQGEFENDLYDECTKGVHKKMRALNPA